ncbi:hypothetical protein AB9M62_33050 [Bacillales bacterium AN1005]
MSNDVQVSMKQLEGWKSALQGHSNVSPAIINDNVKWIKGLN